MENKVGDSVGIIKGLEWPYLENFAQGVTNAADLVKGARMGCQASADTFRPKVKDLQSTMHITRKDGVTMILMQPLVQSPQTQ